MALDTERKRVAHLLRRFALGASEAELDYYLQDGEAGAIQRLLAYEDQPEWQFDIDLFRNEDNGGLNIRFPMAHWYLRLLLTRRPLEEKLTIFWHDHFATSAMKVTLAEAMHDHIGTIRRHATGRFLDLLTAVSKDPAMLFWLDNQTNVRGKPNENFARELMELFTLGIGHYTEEDIQEAARAFTGMSFRVERARADTARPGRRWAYQFFPGRHDAGLKSVLGKSGRLDGDDVLSHLCLQPQTARYLVEKMWSWFAYPEPEKALVDRLASRYLQSGLDTEELVRAIMQSEEFYSEKSERAQIKNPIDFCVVTARQIGLGAVAEQLEQRVQGPGQPARQFAGLGFVLANATEAQGMQLTYPPDVAGWESGKAWITTASMVERIKWGETLFVGAQRDRRQVQRRGLLQPYALFRGNTPDEAALRLASIFDIELSPEKQEQLKSAATKATNGGRVTTENAGELGASVAKLVFGSPEFQFA